MDCVREGTMPPKIRELITEFERAGFVDRGGKGSHRNVVHPRLVVTPVTLSGRPGDDAKAYQERLVRKAIKEAGT
jgi:predicted RNA binding protein YcfA (HicA-like mRNA interferase family)